MIINKKTEYVKEWQAEKYKKITVYLKKDEAQSIKENEEGKSMNMIVRQALAKCGYIENAELYK